MQAGDLVARRSGCLRRAGHGTRRCGHSSPPCASGIPRNRACPGRARPCSRRQLTGILIGSRLGPCTCRCTGFCFGFSPFTLHRRQAGGRLRAGAAAAAPGAGWRAAAAGGSAGAADSLADASRCRCAGAGRMTVLRQQSAAGDRDKSGGRERLTVALAGRSVRRMRVLSCLHDAPRNLRLAHHTRRQDAEVKPVNAASTHMCAAAMQCSGTGPRHARAHAACGSPRRSTRPSQSGVPQQSPKTKKRPMREAAYAAFLYTPVGSAPNQRFGQPTEGVERGRL